MLGGLCPRRRDHDGRSLRLPSPLWGEGQGDGAVSPFPHEPLTSRVSAAYAPPRPVPARLVPLAPLAPTRWRAT